MAIIRQIEVEVGIDEFSTEELIEEIEHRGYNLLENSSKYDLSLVDDSVLIGAVTNLGYYVGEANPLPRETLEYILKSLPEEKFGSENYFHVQTIRDLYNRS